MSDRAGLPRSRARRNLVVAAASIPVAAALDALAQRDGKRWRVGFLSPRRRPSSLDSDYYGAFPRRMMELGYIEGRNLAIEWRFAEGRYERLAAMAQELVRLGVDAIIGAGPPGATAAQNATGDIPIVFVVSIDPVRAGYVKSLAQPGGNMTGLVNLAADLASKHLEMLKSLVPRLASVAVLLNEANSGHATIWSNVVTAARKAGVEAFAVHAQTVEEIGGAFATIASRRAGALVVALDPLFIQQERDIARRAIQLKLPSIFANREYAEAGGLMAYGQNQVQIYRRVAEYVDRIFRGARPAQLPVEQPTQLELVINATTARVLGIGIPKALATSAEIVE